MYIGMYIYFEGMFMDARNNKNVSPKIVYVRNFLNPLTSDYLYEKWMMFLVCPAGSLEIQGCSMLSLT